MDAESPVKLLPVKRARYDIDFEKCLICQEVKKEPLCRSTAVGLNTLEKAAHVRGPEDDVSSRLIAAHEENRLHDILWHERCYKNHTNKTLLDRIRKRTLESESICSSSGMPTSSVDNSKTIPIVRKRSGQSVDWKMCIICQKSSCKGVRELIVLRTADGEFNLRKAIKDLEDDTMFMRISDVTDLIAADCKYHKTCRDQYINKANRVLKRKLEVPVKNIHDTAFSKLVENITNDLFKLGCPLELPQLLHQYKQLLNDHMTCSENYRSDKLKKRLEKHFGDRIIFLNNGQKGTIVLSTQITLDRAISAVGNIKQQKKYEYHSLPSTATNCAGGIFPDVVFAASSILRNELHTVTAPEFIDFVPDEVKIERACEMVPDSLYMFLKWLIEGSEGDESINLQCVQSTNPSIHRRIISIAQDIIFSATGKKTPKHVGLAGAIHSMTGSKEVISWLNHLGHTVSYSTWKRIDTTMAQSQLQKLEQDDIFIPSQIVPGGGLVEAAADNDDINEETLDGKNTTHATTTVLYQRDEEEQESVTAAHYREDNKGHFGYLMQPRKRSLDANPNLTKLKDFSLYGRKPTPKLLGSIDMKWFTTATERHQASLIDMAWILGRMCPIKLFNIELIPNLSSPTQNIPSWSGFFAKVSCVLSPKTKIGYCPILPASPTQFNTVYTVMKNVQNMMLKLGQKHSIITMDEAIYCKAKQIQWKEPQEFEDTVIRLGGMHIALTFLAVIGLFVQGSGLEDIMVDSGVYGSNTATHILSGKSYNRGIRAHKLAFECFQRLRWQAFSKWLNDEHIEHDLDTDAITDKLREMQDAKTDDELQEVIHSLVDMLEPLEPLLASFDKHVSAVSKTSAFYLEYLSMVNILLDFIKAERDGIWEMHLQAVHDMLPYFFAFDRINYARWATVYYVDMKLLPNTASEVHHHYTKGFHPVNRSGTAKFNQVWTDMALEQSLNRDSKTQGGIIGFSKKPGAVMRWIITAHERTAVVSAVKSMCGVNSLDTTHGHKESSTTRTCRDETDVNKLIDTIITKATNPFIIEDPALLNLITGKVAPSNVADDLLGAHSTGINQLKSFVEDRLNTSTTGFHEPLHKLKLKSFSTLNRKVKVSSSKEKEKSINADRELFGRLVIIAQSRKVDVKHLFTYELNAVPLSLAHVDGTLRKASNKATLLHHLEKDVDKYLKPTPSELQTCYLIDGIALLHMLKNKQYDTFSNLAKDVLAIVLHKFAEAHCDQVHVVFDRYDIKHSIKTGERARRQGTQTFGEIRITNPQTKITLPLNKILSNPQNKANIIQFLSESLCDAAPKMLKENQCLYIGGGFQDMLKTVQITAGHVNIVPSLSSCQEEADTRLFLHASYAAQSCKKVILWSPDSDVGILCLYYCTNLGVQEWWFRTGTGDKERYIPIHVISDNLGPDICILLPAIHALSGCDSTSSMAHVGKVSFLKAITSDINSFKGIMGLGEKVYLSEETFRSVESLVAQVYGKMKCEGVNKLRYQLFAQNQKSNEKLPPTKDSLHLHVERANYQVYVWRHATEIGIDLPSPVGHGWELNEDDQLIPKLMSQAPAPSVLLELVTCSCKASACKGKCSCASQGLSCTEACMCMNDVEKCQNKYQASMSDSDSEGDE